MCSYSASTLAIRAKCSLSFHYLCILNDQPFCCHHPCCQFSVSPRLFSGYLLGLSSQLHSKVLSHAGRRRVRVCYRSRDFDMMGLLAEPEERFTALGEPVWRKARREIQVESIEGKCRRSRKEEITGIRSPRRSDGLSSVCDSELNKVGRGRGRAGGNSLVRYGNRKEDTGYNEVDVAEDEVQEVHKYVDDSWRERRYSSKRDVNLDSRKDESTKRYGSSGRLGVNSAGEKTVQRANLSQQGNIRESVLNGRSKKITKISEAQLNDELDNVKRTSVSTNVRKIEKESSASAARQNDDMDHQVARHDQRRRSLVEQSKVADFRYNDVQSAAYRQRDFEETSIRGRQERAYLEQNSSQVSRDKRIHFHGQALEQHESRRSTHRPNEVSLSSGSDFERTLPIDGESVKVMDAIPTLAQDSSQASRDKRSQMEMDLHLSVENISEEREAKLIITGNSIQLSGGERKQIDKGAVEHDKTRRNSQMLGEVSEVYSVNMEAFPLSGENRGNSCSVQSSVPAKKDKGTQVEMHDAYCDQIEMPGFTANNVVNATSSWKSPASRVDIQEYSPLLASNQISSIRKQNDQASKHAYLMYDAQMEFERSTSEFDLERGYNIRISNSNETYNSRSQNEKAFTSTEYTSYVLTQEQEEQRSSLTGQSSQYESMEMTSTGNLHAISSSQPPTCSELNYDAGWGYQKGQYDTNYRARKLDKSSCLLADEFVDSLQKVVALKESGKAPNVSVGIQIGKPGRRDIQSTLRIENQNETSSTVLTQERKERLSSLLVGDNSQHKTQKISSTGSLGDVSSSVKIYSEVDNHRGRDDIRHITLDTIESAFDKSSVFRSDEFVDEIQQEIMSPNESGKEPSVSSRIQIEETGGSQSEGTAVMQIGELSDSRGYGDDRHIKEGGRLSSSGSGMRGPSEEMWGDEIQSSQETSKAEEPEENSPTSEAMDLTAPTLENAITRRSPKSLWSFLADIIQMSWILRGNSRSSTLKPDKRSSSNESLSSEAWFSGPEPDENGAGDESRNTKQIGLIKDSGVVTGSVELPLQELKKVDSLAVMEQNSSIASGFMTSGLSARTASSSAEADSTQYSKSSQGTLSNVVIVEQQLESALPSASGIVESRVRDKVKVLKQSASYPSAVMRVGFSSAITQETGAEQMEAAQVGKGDNSSLEISELLLSSKVDSALPRITDPEEVDRPGIIPMLELDPFEEKLPEVGEIKETGIKQRKFQRNKQVPSEQFDEWEKAFKLENEQKKLDEFFMREAILDAKKGSDAWEVPVGAVLVQNGKIIARGCNMVEELRDSTAHAEMICIREASSLTRSWRLADTTLYVTLEPCPMCAGAILQARIDTVVWGAPNRLLGADGSWVRLFPGGDGGSSSMNPPSQMTGPVHPFHPNIKIRRGVLETECGDVMQQFFKLRRKKDKKPESSPPPSYLPLSNRPVKFFSKLHNIFCMMFCM